MRANRLRIAVLVTALSGCSNGSTYTPWITSVSDGTSAIRYAVAVGASQATIRGAFFTPQTVVSWNGQPQATTWKSDTQLEVKLGAAATREAGIATVTAVSEDSFASPPASVQMLVAQAIRLDSVAPQSVAAGVPDFMLTANGAGFVPTSAVLWNDTALATVFVSGNELTATVPAALVAVAGDAVIKVSQPGCTYQPPCFSGNLVLGVGTPARVVVLQQGGGDLVWDATHALLFSVLQLYSWSGAIAPIDPVAGAVGAQLPGSFVAQQLAISDGDLFLYATEFGASSALRYALPLASSATQVPPYPTSYYPAVVAAAPGAPESVAFVDDISGKVGMIDGDTVRPNLAGGFRPESLVFGADATKLFGVDTTSRKLIAFSVDALGVNAGTAVAGAAFGNLSRLHFDPAAQRLYGDNGENFDQQGASQGAFVLPNAACKAAMDGAAGKVFFACSEQGVGLTLRSYALGTRQLIARVLLQAGTTIFPAPDALVRWGVDGLALTTTTNIYLYSGPFVQ